MALPVVEALTVGQLSALLGGTGPRPLLLDCREPEEVAIARIDGAVHIPMREVPRRLAELGRDRDIVVYCHSGQRSLAVAAFLKEEGYPRVRNLCGGIDAWSREVDPGVPRY